MRLTLAFLCSAALAAAEHGEILAVLGPDRIAIQYYQLPVVVRLAEIEIPAEHAEQAQARLGEATGKKSNITWAPDLGADDAGTPRVYVAIGGASASLSEVLVEAGLARFTPLGQGGRQRERLAAAEVKAKKTKAGVWALAAAPSPAAAPAAPAKSAAGQFVAEVDGKHFYPADAPEAARLNAKRLVRYASEAAARKAGKQPYAPSAPGAIATLEEARAAYGRAKALCEQAAGQGPTEERDKLYERAFLELSGAMQVFSAAAEAKPADEALGEELRQCTQLRYAAMKSKRYH
jgi:endonuclease YncB( thermonuclease family)